MLKGEAEVGPALPADLLAAIFARLAPEHRCARWWLRQ